MKSIRVVQLTDTHLFTDPKGELLGVDTLASFNLVLAEMQLRSSPVDAILATGDLAQDGTADAYHHLIQTLEPLNIPTHCTSGNHDDPEVMRRCLNGSKVRWSGDAALGHWHCVLLNTTVAGAEHGELSSEELARLERLLAEHHDRHILLALHHPAVEIGSFWMDAMVLRNREDFFGIVDQFENVRAVVWGHAHQEFTEQRGGVSLYGSPSTCFQFAPKSNDFTLDMRPPGYRWFDLNADGSYSTGVKRVKEYPMLPDASISGY